MAVVTFVTWTCMFDVELGLRFDDNDPVCLVS